MPDPAHNPAYRTWPRTFLLASLFLYLLPLALIRIPSFEHWGGTPFGPALDYPYTLEKQNAGVVIFGDSSATVGIDPRQLSAELGIKVIDLPNTGASLQVVGDQSLRDYLAHNQPPRLILFYFAPWNLDYAGKAASAHVYEGDEVLLRRGTFARIAGYALRHPAEILEFPIRFYAASPPSALRNLLRRRHPAVEVATTQGYSDPMAAHAALAEPCQIPAELLADAGTVTVQALLARYHTPRTQVALLLAPIPACVNSSILTSRVQPGMAQPVLPVGDFKQDFAYVHLRPTAVSGNSARVAGLIRPLLDF